MNGKKKKNKERFKDVEKEVYQKKNSLKKKISNKYRQIKSFRNLLFCEKVMFQGLLWSDSFFWVIHKHLFQQVNERQIFCL